MSLPAKIGVSSLIIGTTTGISSALGTYFGTNRETVKKGKSVGDLITDKYDYILLATSGESDNSEWKKILTNYKGENAKEKGKDALQLAGWPIAEEKNLIKQFQQKCKELSNNIGGNVGDDLYKKVVKYCARGITVAEQAARENLRIVNTEGDSDLTIWLNRLSRNAILGNDLQKLGVKVMNTLLNSAAIKEGCNASKTRNKKERGYDGIYQAYKKVCTKGDKE